jgi:uncharacterized protein YggE
MKLIRILAVAAAVGALAVVVAAERPGPAHSAAPEQANGITVTGSGTVRAIPDTATFSFAVSSDAPTSAAALRSNADKMAGVLRALDAARVAKSDIRTDDVSVYPKYDEPGYTARNSVSVTLHDVKGAGAIVDKVTAAGATDVFGPSFGRESRAALYQQALRKAVADARAKAATLADATGVSLGRVSRVEEGQEPTFGCGGGICPLLARAAEQSTQIEPGTQDVQATVTVTFAIG